MELSIIIPTLNEENNISELIKHVKNVVSELKITFEIIIIDGGSIDKTVENAKEAGADVINQKIPGYGGALIEGFKASKGKYIITMDADYSHNPYFISQMWHFRNKSDVIIASRYVKGGSAESMPKFRRILSIILNKVFTFGLSLPLKDMSSGFRMYNRRVFDDIEIIGRDFDALEEILIKAYINGWQIMEVPFHYQMRKSGSSNAKLLKFACSYTKTFYKMWQLRNSILSADYDERAFDSRIFIQRYWQRKRYEIIMNYIKKDAWVLDIGCGSSKIFMNLKNAVGLDIDLKKLRYLRKKSNLLIKGDINFLPFKKEEFECVICSEVIEHVPYSAEIFQEISRVLKQNGTLIIGTPDYGRLIWRAIEFVYNLLLPRAYAQVHITQFNRKQLIEELEKAGFQILDYKYICSSELIIKAKKKS